MQQRPHAGLARQRLPGALEHLRVEVMPVPAPVGVRALEAGVLGLEAVDDLVGDAADDLGRPLARRVEGVEGVEHARGGAAEEAEAIDQHDVGARPSRRDRRGRARRAGADDEHVAGLTCSYVRA